jgi:hypothetical protein
LITPTPPSTSSTCCLKNTPPKPDNEKPGAKSGFLY